MAKNWQEITVSFDYEVRYMQNGDFILSIMWKNVGWNGVWFSNYCRRCINGAHDPLNKLERSWN